MWIKLWEDLNSNIFHLIQNQSEKTASMLAIISITQLQYLSILFILTLLRTKIYEGSKALKGWNNFFNL